MPISEAELMRLITDACELLGWQWMHLRPGRTAHGWRTPVSGPLGAGFPDLFLVDPRRQRTLLIECKTNSGTVSALQATTIETLRSAGMTVLVVRPKDVDVLIETVLR